MRIRNSLCLIFAGAMFSLLSGQGAPPHGAPSASQPVSPKESLRGFFNAVAGGDRDKALGELWFKDEAAKKEADAVVGLELSKTQLSKLLSDTFSEKAGDDVMPPEAQKHLIDEIEKADVKIDGDAAQISPGDGPTMYMVRHDGKWQIDFAKMQETNPEEHLDAEGIDSGIGQLKIYEAVIDGVKARKYASADEVHEDLDKRLGDFAKTDPAAKIKSTRASIATTKQALATFEVDHDRFPTEAEGLDALVHQPAGMKDWHPLLEKLPKDAWGHDFVYHNPAKRGDAFYDLFSPGPDGKPDTDDDVTEGGRGKGK